MSYYEDYVADGLCCECCGVCIDRKEPGYPRMCSECKRDLLKQTKRKEVKRDEHQKARPKG